MTNGNLLIQPGEGVVASSIGALFGIINNGTKASCLETSLATLTNSTMIAAALEEAENTKRSLEQDAKRTYLDAASKFVSAGSTIGSFIATAVVGSKSSKKVDAERTAKETCEMQRQALREIDTTPTLAQARGRLSQADIQQRLNTLTSTPTQRTTTKAAFQRQCGIFDRDQVKELADKLDQEIKAHDTEMNTSSNGMNNKTQVVNGITNAISNVGAGGFGCGEGETFKEKGEYDKDVTLLKAAQQLLGAIVGQEGRQQDAATQEERSAVEVIGALIQAARVA